MSKLSCVVGLLVLWARLASFASDSFDQWQWRNPLPTGNDLFSVTYAHGRFAAVGYYGAIESSLDGTNWTSRTIGPISGVGTNYGLEAVAWANGTWVMVGSGGPGPTSDDAAIVLTSPDLTNWTRQTVPLDVYTLMGIVYGNGMFVAAGGSSIVTSQDGTNWTEQTTPAVLPALHGVIYGGGLFAISGWPGTLLTSPDAVNWSICYAQAWYGSGWYNWISDGMAYGNGVYFDVGPGILASFDGVNWTNVVSSIGALSIGYGSDQFVAFGANGQLQTSTNGSNWVQRGTLPMATVGNIRALGSGNGTFEAVGAWVRLVSNDGINWTNLASAVTTNDIEDACYGLGGFVAVGSDGTILRSQDGVRWSPSHNPAPANINLMAVACGGSDFVTVADNGQILNSTNGVNWSGVYSAGQALSEVTYCGGQFIAAGSNGTILTSVDGNAWVAQASRVTNALSGLAYGNGLYVAGAGTGVLTSPDGATWTGHYFNFITGAGIAGLAYGNGLFVAVGDSGQIFTSPDATTWGMISSGSIADFYRVTFANGTFLACGSQGALITSIDGTNWVNRNSGATVGLHGATFGQNTYVVVGDSGTILQSGLLGAQLSPTPGWANGAFGLTMLAPAGGQWNLQASTDLLNWSSVGTIMITNSPTPFTDTGATNFPHRFYRAVSH